MAVINPDSVFPDQFFPEQLASTVAASQVTYDGGALSNISGANSAALFESTDTALSAINTTLAAIVTSSITNYDGTSVFTNFTLTAGGTLNVVIAEVADEIDDLIDVVGLLDTDDIAQAPGLSPVNYTPTAATSTGNFDGIDDEFGTQIAAIATKLTEADNATAVKAYIQDFREGIAATINNTGLSTDVTVTEHFVNGFYRTSAADPTITLTATKDNYIDVDEDGTFFNSVVTISDPAPSTLGYRIAVLTTDGSNVTATVNLENTDPFDGGDIQDVSVPATKIVAASITATQLEVAGTAETVALPEVTTDATGRVTAMTSKADISAITNGQLLLWNTGNVRLEPATKLFLPTGNTNYTLRKDAGGQWVASQFVTNTSTEFQIGLDPDGGLRFSGGDLTTTSGNTPAVIQASLQLLEKEAFMIEAYVIANETDTVDSAMYKSSALFHRATAGNITLEGAVQSQILVESAGAAGWSIDIVANTGAQTADVQITGAVATDINWRCIIKEIRVGNT